MWFWFKKIQWDGWVLGLGWVWLLTNTYRYPRSQAELAWVLNEPMPAFWNALNGILPCALHLFPSNGSAYAKTLFRSDARYSCACQTVVVFSWSAVLFTHHYGTHSISSPVCIMKHFSSLTQTALFRRIQTSVVCGQGVLSLPSFLSLKDMLNSTCPRTDGTVLAYICNSKKANQTLLKYPNPERSQNT